MCILAYLHLDENLQKCQWCVLRALKSYSRIFFHYILFRSIVTLSIFTKVSQKPLWFGLFVNFLFQKLLSHNLLCINLFYFTFKWKNHSIGTHHSVPALKWILHFGIQLYFIRIIIRYSVKSITSLTKSGMSTTFRGNTFRYNFRDPLIFVNYSKTWRL